jgi:hypothetical protein
MYYKDGQLIPPQEMMDGISKKKEYKPKKIAPKHCFIFDDISQELKNSGLLSLCKKSRHFKASVFLSSHSMSMTFNHRPPSNMITSYAFQSLLKRQVRPHP